MTRREFAASIAGATAVLAITAALALAAAQLTPHAQAQQPRDSTDAERLLLRSIAGAMASIAVDGERTAVAVNDAVDQIKALQDRVAALEKKIAEMQAKR